MVYSKAKVISFTKPSVELISEGIEDINDIIAFCARVSNPSNQYNVETAERLLRYLMKNKHWSPFEMANVCVEVETTRDIARQVLRHKSMNFQEYSQRYADPVKELEFIIREARFQDTKNRQNSIDVVDEKLTDEWKQVQEQVIQKSKEAYEWAISKGIAKEVARSVLPEGNTMSRMYINGSIRSWIHYLEARLDPTTQKEHRELALAITNEISLVFPLIFNIVKKD